MNQDYPIELTAPDIEPYKTGNTGIDYVTTFDSGKAGPHVMLSAVVHGNELCGAIALDWLFKREVRPLRGKLTLGFMNIEAYHNFQPTAPEGSRFVDEDFNRVWAEEVLEGDRDSVELRRAREVRPIIDRIDILLDIHSMQHSNVPLMMCGPLQKGRQLAQELGIPEHIVSDQGHAAGTRMRDYAGFGHVDSAKNALLIECGQHWQASSEVVAKQVVVQFLRHFDLIDAHFAADLAMPEPKPSKLIEVTEAVTIKTAQFTFAQPFVGMECLAKKGTLIGYDGDEAVRTPYDDCVLIMPSKRLYKNQTAVRLGQLI